MLALELSSCGQIGLLMVGLCEEKGLIQTGLSGVRVKGILWGMLCPGKPIFVTSSALFMTEMPPSMGHCRKWTYTEEP